MHYFNKEIDEFIVKPKLQRDWIKGRAIWLLLAIYLGGIGGGLYISSVLANWQKGLIIAVIITAILKGGAHLLFLTRPLNFWRIFVRPQTSWISRGIYFVFLFIIFGLLYYYKGGEIIRIISLFFAFCLIIYTGFVLLASRAIPFWNNPLLPVLFVSVSLASGMSLIEAIHIFFPAQNISNLELLKVAGTWLIVITAFLVFIYLSGAFFSSVFAKESVIYLLKGKVSALFYIGVLILGIMLPLIIFILISVKILPSSTLAIAGISELIGAFILRYSILKAGIYLTIV